MRCVWTAGVTVCSRATLSNGWCRCQSAAYTSCRGENHGKRIMFCTWTEIGVVLA